MVQEEKEHGMVAWAGGRVVLLGGDHQVMCELGVGEIYELFLEGYWQAIRVCSGGYKGWYYQTVSGIRGRFAGCMRVRVFSGQTWEQCQRAYWVGRSVRSRVLFGGRCVQGVVQELTERGKVVFVYRVPLSEVAVRVVFPVERVADVLAA